MKTAKEIRKITNESKTTFDNEITRIEKEIIKRAKDGHESVSVQVPEEIARKINDELVINGYKAMNHPGSNTVEISW